MFEYALTGGIGAGKSTVASGLVARGAALVDSDLIVRELQQPGAEVFEAMVAHFGDRIVADDGTLNRQAVADVAFSDPQQLDALNKLVHPPVVAEMLRRREAHLAAGRIVVVDIPLLVLPDGTIGRQEYLNFAGRIVVDCDLEVAVARLVGLRGFSEDDAWARIASQATRDQRIAHADRVIDNSGDLALLEPQLDDCWAWMVAGP
jgi:dephospho-CoA kinase